MAPSSYPSPLSVFFIFYFYSTNVLSTVLQVLKVDILVFFMSYVLTFPVFLMSYRLLFLCLYFTICSSCLSRGM